MRDELHNNTHDFWWNARHNSFNFGFRPRLFIVLLRNIIPTCELCTTVYTVYIIQGCWSVGCSSGVPPLVSQHVCYLKSYKISHLNNLILQPGVWQYFISKFRISAVAYDILKNTIPIFFFQSLETCMRVFQTVTTYL